MQFNELRDYYFKQVIFLLCLTKNKCFSTFFKLIDFVLFLILKLALLAIQKIFLNNFPTLDSIIT